MRCRLAREGVRAPVRNVVRATGCDLGEAGSVGVRGVDVVAGGGREDVENDLGAVGRPPRTEATAGRRLGDRAAASLAVDADLPQPAAVGLYGPERVAHGCTDVAGEHDRVALRRPVAGGGDDRPRCSDLAQALVVDLDDVQADRLFLLFVIEAGEDEALAVGGVVARKIVAARV